ncbi:hypothetical protein BGZ60DRAFT_429430 [Tricladium varicosporioides]|nr:hypothetical protein BGZ60DRAFT_429430 [Hymenoscyphus varicosporioides]
MATHMVLSQKTIREVSASLNHFKPDMIASFPGFQHFPSEIRLKIWNQAANDPQIVNAQLIWDPWKTPTLRSNAFQTTTTHLKGLLGACQESRSEAKKKLDQNLTIWGSPKSFVRVYFNPSVDTLWFSELFMAEKLLESFLTQIQTGLERVRYIAYPLWGAGLLHRLADIFHHLPQLKRFYLTDYSSDDQASDTGGDVVLLETNYTVEEEVDIVDAIKAKYENPSLVVTREMVEKYIRQTVQERMTDDKDLDSRVIIPRMKIGKIGHRPRLRRHTWALGCCCKFCQEREQKYPFGPPPLPKRLF